jgi:transcriptional regulator with XRE-family HTH domain
MKIQQANTLNENLSAELIGMGRQLARLRMARRVTQSDAAIRAGISRRTAGAIESGSPSVSIGQTLRYLDAIASGLTLLDLLKGNDPSLIALEIREKRVRARALTENELKKLDF